MHRFKYRDLKVYVLVTLKACVLVTELRNTYFMCTYIGLRVLVLYVCVCTHRITFTCIWANSKLSCEPNARNLSDSFVILVLLDQ